MKHCWHKVGITHNVTLHSKYHEQQHKCCHCGALVMRKKVRRGGAKHGEHIEVLTDWLWEDLPTDGCVPKEAA